MAGRVWHKCRLSLRESTPFRAAKGDTGAALLLVLFCCLATAGYAAELPPPAEQPVDFAADVQPIFARRCYACHGPEKQKSSFRLDVGEAALEGGDLGQAILSGKSDESPLIHYVSGLEEGLEMPPEGERLTGAEIGILRRWIDDGAKWPASKSQTDPRDWWSLKPLSVVFRSAEERPFAERKATNERPFVERKATNERPFAEQKATLDGNPIDAFILARLESAGLAPSPEADRRTLVRRLYFNLIGLPPTPEQVEAFVNDADPLAYERLVDRLLASPRYGERWARHWLDVVHFAETHGHDQDRPRENAWPYRDYVIAALNDDKPYARFVEEQIAADALFPQHPELTPALGFLAAGPWDESSLRDIREDTLDRQIGRYLDRDDIITNVMSTFLSTTVHCARCHHHKFDPIRQEEYYALQAVFAGTEKAERSYLPDPQTHVRRQELVRARQALEAREPSAIAWLLAPDQQELLNHWEASLTKAAQQWTTLEPETYTADKGTKLDRLQDGSLLASGEIDGADNYTVIANSTLREVTALRLEVLSHDSLPKQGPGRAENGNLHLTEFRVAVVQGDGTETPVALQNPTADFNQSGWEIAKAIDGNGQSAWGIFPETGKSHVAMFELKQPLTLADSARLRIILEQQHGRMHTIGRLRLSVTNQPLPVKATPLAPELAAILARPRDQRTEAEQEELAVRFGLEQIDRQLSALPAAQMVYAGTPAGQVRPIHVLRRGEITQPLAEASPGALSCLVELPPALELSNPASEAERRAALARWITDPRNALAWRSIVNRVWHYHFGRGLVDTPNDFGRLGSQPSHPELLDWLAADFRDSGGSLKRLHRQIVLSATWRQSSQSRPEAARLDADNRLLWRMPRERLDAEAVRDALVQFSGKLDLTMGGPSARQFNMSPGIHVTPKVDYAGFDVDAPGNYRRSIYRFLFRTLPDPFMDALDCPAGDQWAPVRSESVTALQAFAMLNNPFVLRQCEHIAARLEAETPEGERVERLFRLLLQRSPTVAESEAFAGYTQRHGLASACRVLVNSNEFLFID